METVSAVLVRKLLQRNIIIPEKAEIYKTGITLILADIINFTLIILIGILTKSLLYSIIYLVLLWTVRRFSGGFHAKTYWMCRLCTVGTYILIFLVSKMIVGNLFAHTIICNVAAIISMLIFAPVRHPNKSLNEREKKANKFFAVITTLFFAAISIILIGIGRKEGLIISLTLFAISVLMYIGMLINRREGKNNVKNFR